jgi:hypothetical protein
MVVVSSNALHFSALVEGNSINAIVRMTGVAKHTVLKLIEDMGCACAAYHHRNVRRLRVRRLQCDEIWAFVGAKAKNVTVYKGLKTGNPTLRWGSVGFNIPKWLRG